MSYFKAIAIKQIAFIDKTIVNSMQKQSVHMKLLDEPPLTKLRSIQPNMMFIRVIDNHFYLSARCISFFFHAEEQDNVLFLHLAFLFHEHSTILDHTNGKAVCFSPQAKLF
mmetsp:Transcript_62171/g.72705  ORF Transcript_62171/g.72705 Transcript_62171/m.72705 type:complete len:111 (+) Transcript_62171:243-575(+)